MEPVAAHFALGLLDPGIIRKKRFLYNLFLSIKKHTIRKGDELMGDNSADDDDIIKIFLFSTYSYANVNM